MTPPPQLVLVTDRHATPGGLITTLERLLPHADARVAVWFRERDLEAAPRRRLALSVAERVHRSPASLWVSEDPELARELGAHALQLPAGHPLPEDLGSLAVGRACHDAEALRRARAEGVDWAVYSPVFGVPGKGEPLGLEGLAAGCAGVSPLPVLALGGIDSDSLQAVRGAGAAGAVVRRAVFAAEDPGRALRALLQRLDHPESVPPPSPVR